jgi:hypothetical protein
MKNNALSKRKNTKLNWCFFLIVAGPGLAPGSSGYEPDEILLLYPAKITYLAIQ